MDRRLLQQPAVLLGAIAVFAALMLYCNWVGFLATDDDIYLSWAERWVEDFPQYGDNHWGIRYTLVLPLALTVSLLGSSALALAIPSLIYFALWLLAAYWLVSRFFPNTVTAFSLFLMLLTPLLVVTASIANVDQAELFYVLLALIAFEKAIDEEGDLVWLFAVGVAVGFAALSRLTAVGLALYFALFFLRGAHFSRWRYWMIAAGFLLVLGGDAIFHTVVAGEPLQRILVPLNSHASVDRILSLRDYTSGTGNISDNQLLAPILAIMVNQEFGLTFPFFLAAAWFCLRDRRFNDRQRRLLVHLIVLAAVWFLWIGYSHTVRPLPRYYSIATVAALVVVAVWLWHIVGARRPMLAMLLTAALIGANVLCMIVENKSPRYFMQVLAEVAAMHDEPIYTDKETARRADTLLHWQGEVVAARVRGGEAPTAGALYLHAPGSPGAGQVKPGADWTVVARYEDERFARLLLDIIGARSWMPGSIYQRVAWPNPPVVLYRTP